MRKFTIPMAIVAGLIAPSALAADMAVKAPAPPPQPVWSWTGWYAGVNVGASFGRAQTDINDATTVTSTVVLTGAAPAPATLVGASTFGFGNTDTGYPSGFMGGGQIGYNWQYSPLIVVGLEADFQGALESDSSTRTDNFSGPLTPSGPCVTVPPGGSCSVNLGAAGSRTLDFQTKIDWFGTVRPRIGYVWGNGEVMSYITGGLAYGEVKINGTSTASGATASLSVPFSVTESFGQSHVNTGWVAGYGTEGHLSGNWTWKVEGLWMDLGSVDATGTGVGPTTTAAPFTCFTVHTTCTATVGANGQTTTHTHFTDGILRAGLNYKFY